MEPKLGMPVCALLESSKKIKLTWYTLECLVTCKREHSIFISWDIGVLKLLQSDWPRAFWAITQNGEWGITNYKIFCSRLVLKNSKKKNFSENLGNLFLLLFSPSISKSEFSKKTTILCLVNCKGSEEGIVKWNFIFGSTSPPISLYSVQLV